MATDYLVDVDRATGAFISGWPRISQSIKTILTTRLRRRVMRLGWGSKFMDVMDKPLNEVTGLDGIMAAIEAVDAYEPEFKITNVAVTQAAADGSMTILLTGVDLIQNTRRQTSVTL